MTTVLNNRIFLILVLSSLLSACGWLNNGPDDSVVDISEEFSVYAVEGFSEDGRTIILKMSTLDNMCETSEIELETSQSNDYIDVRIKKVQEPDTCLTQMKTLRSSAEFDVISRQRYYLNISLRDIVDNTGNIEIYDDRILTNIEDQEGIVVDPVETLRLPENTIWGYARSFEVDYTGQIIDFVTDLSIISQSIVLKPGQYSGFTIDNTGQLEFDDQQPGMGDAQFFYKFTGDEQELIDLLQEYRDDAGAKADFRIFSTNGKIY